MAETSYKHKIIQNVCEKIANAQGANKPLPLIKVNTRSSKKKYVAYYNPEPVPEIQIDEEFYDLCVSFGPDSLNALACILGHELSHHYNSHGLTYSFAEMLNSELQTNDASAANSLMLKLKESEADYFGLFYGYIAGFENYQVFPAVLDSIYSHYRIKDNLKNYPTKNERKEIGINAVKKINLCVNVFKTARFLYIKKDYQAAITCMSYLLNYFPSKEIYNNVAVIQLQFALEKLPKNKVWFSYPFEYDSKSRLDYSATRSVPEDENITKLLDAAILNLEKAITFDILYEPAYINLACAFSLKGNYDKSIGEINELEEVYKRKGTNLPGNAYLIRAISRLLNEQPAKAKIDLLLAEENLADNIKFNKAVFDMVENKEKASDENIQEYIYKWIKGISENNSLSTNSTLTANISITVFDEIIYSDTISFGTLSNPLSIYSSEKKSSGIMKITLYNKEYMLQESDSIILSGSRVLKTGLLFENVAEFTGTKYQTLDFAWKQKAVSFSSNKLILFLNENKIDKFCKYYTKWL